eukprot:g70557.t1
MSREIILIGSGATAVTILPALANAASHLTLLQRSPGYVVPIPSHLQTSGFWYWLNKLMMFCLGAKRTHQLQRWGYLLEEQLMYNLARRFPNTIKWEVERRGRPYLSPEMLPKFQPSYNPWDQRPCATPNGDFQLAVSNTQKVTVVNEGVGSFTSDGVRTTGGQEVRADLVVLATGMRLQPFGKMRVIMDGVTISEDSPAHPCDNYAFQGCMLSGVPNMWFTFGYINASWTLKVEVVAKFALATIKYMEQNGRTVVTPSSPNDTSCRAPIWNELSSNYVKRDFQKFPKQAKNSPWRYHNNYLRDLWELRAGSLKHLHQAAQLTYLYLNTSFDKASSKPCTDGSDLP